MLSSGPKIMIKKKSLQKTILYYDQLINPIQCQSKIVYWKISSNVEDYWFFLSMYYDTDKKRICNELPLTQIINYRERY